MTGYSRDELFPPKTFMLKNTLEPRFLTIKGIRRETFTDKDTGEVKEKPALEFEGTTAVWTFSLTAYDRLCVQLGESDPRVWGQRRIRIKLYPLEGALYVNDKPITILVADVVDREEAEVVKLDEVSKSGGSNRGSPPPDNFSDSIPF
jgi:hypothetical protein